MLLFKVGNVLACQRLLYASVHAFASEGFGDVGEVVGSAFNGDGVFAAAGGLQQADVGVDACAFGSIKQVAIGGQSVLYGQQQADQMFRFSDEMTRALCSIPSNVFLFLFVLAGYYLLKRFPPKPKREAKMMDPSEDPDSLDDL